MKWKSWLRAGPPLVWTYDQTGLGYSGPAIVGDRLYIMGGRQATTGWTSYLTALFTTRLYQVDIRKAALPGAASFVTQFVLVLLYVYGRLSRHAERFATITGKGFRPRPFDLGRLRWVAAALLVFNFILLLVVRLVRTGGRL